MKTHFHRIFLFHLTKTLLVVMSIMFGSYGIRQAQAQSPVRGERPAIDIANVSDDAVEPGIIRIKFEKSAESLLDHKIPQLNSSGTVEFGIPEIDALNTQFGISSVKQTFAVALSNTQYTERHRLWGFHLWYDLIIPANVNFRTAIQAYTAQSMIATSEPVYKKKLMTDMGEFITYTPSPDNGNVTLNYTPNDPRYNEQWHYHNTGQQSGTVDADIDLPEAWEITKGSNQVVVAVIDDGIDYNHVDLAANMWPGNGYNFVNNNPTIVPGNHGTHVGGTIAANTNNNTGVSGIAGGNGTGNGVRLMSCQVFSGNNNGGFEDAPIWAADNGAAISQNSWSYTSPNYYDQAVLDAIDYFNANGGGTVMNGGITIFSAGNGYSSGLWYPACYSGTFAVAATNNQDMKSWYSNYDTWVNISAPGGETNQVTERGVLSTLTSNTYGFYQGTSMACPHVSGVAALILSLVPGQLSSTDLKIILETSADDITALNPGYENLLGSGRLNAHQALLTAQGYTNPLLPQPPLNLQANAASSSQINLNWLLNASGDQVMLAFNTTNNFGIPTGTYTTGDAITGGGTVIYKGSGTSFAHVALNSSTTYYYALWSVDGTYYSVYAVKSSAKTLCGVENLPFEEHFVSSDFPNCWTQTSTLSDRWQVSNSNVAGGSAYEMRAGWTSGTGTSRLISPPINSSGVSVINLQFKYFFDDYSAGLSYKIQSSADGVNWNDESWSNQSGNGNKSGTVNTTITNNLGGLTYVAWVLEGNHYNFDNWNIDDVVMNAGNSKTLNLTLYPEGLYIGSGTLSKAQNETGDRFAGNIADEIVVELHNAANYNTTIYVSPPVSLLTNGNVSLNIPASFSGSYYLTIKHRNSIETTSVSPVSFAGSSISYAFDTPAKAYGSNLKLSGDGRGLIFVGDANNDNVVDTDDMTIVENDVTTFTAGYVITDMNGDGVIDTGDMTLTDNNAAIFVGAVLP